MLIYDSLMEKDTRGLVPWLAESYSIQDEGRKYVFTLGKSITWHDGVPLTAEDVEFTFDYIRKYPPVECSLDTDDVVSVTAVGERVVEVVVKEFMATLIEDIGMVFIVPKHVWDHIEEPAKYRGEDATVGSGRALAFPDAQDVKRILIDDISKPQQVNAGNFETLADVPSLAYTVTIPALMRSPRILCVARAINGPVHVSCPGAVPRPRKRFGS